MAITERTEQDKIEIVGKFRNIQVRTALIIERDGVEISRSFSRHVVSPGDDATNESTEVKAVADLFHTADIKSAYADFQSKDAEPIA